MKGKDFNEVVELIVRDDPRYEKGAYHFIRQALDFTLQHLEAEGESRDSRHVTGRELLHGIRDYALEQYGPMTMSLFENWGIRSGADFGEIVFNLVECGVFGKRDEDSREDFHNVYDFHNTFVSPFLPRGHQAKTVSPPYSDN